jgi:hypothetical protein
MRLSEIFLSRDEERSRLKRMVCGGKHAIDLALDECLTISPHRISNQFRPVQYLAPDSSVKGCCNELARICIPMQTGDGWSVGRIRSRAVILANLDPYLMERSPLLPLISHSLDVHRGGWHSNCNGKRN